MGRVGRRAILLAVGFACSACMLALMLRLPVYGGSGGTVAAFSYMQPVALPMTVPGTEIVAEFMVVYEGAFLEDGSDRPAVNVAALMLRNVGDTPIREAEVTLERGSQRLTFQAYTIPTGAAVLVLEKDGATGPLADFTACYGWVSLGEDRPLVDSRVGIVEKGMGTLLLTNLTDRGLTDIRVFHKTYYAEGDFYVGGVTYETWLDSLQPGQTLPLYPYHYAAGYSKVVEVRVGGELR